MVHKKLVKISLVAGLGFISTAAWSLPNSPTPTTGKGTLTTDTTLTGAATGSATGITGNAGINGNLAKTPSVQGSTGGPGGVSGNFATYGSTLYAPNAGNPYPPAAYGSGIANTAHDFTGGGSETATIAVGLCTICHTPHKASSTLLLWNHTLSSNTFQWDVAATTAGTALPGFVGSYGGPSAKCLSCHDGSVAIGDIGWFNETSYHGASALLGKMGRTNTRSVGYGGNLSGTHPVAIPYPLNGAPNVYNGSTTGARLATNDFVTDPTANNIRLYSDVGGGTIVGKVTPGQTGIECSSCHDPHNKAANDNFFLRGKLVGGTQASGYICLQCHVK